jgi:hypothetical protein
MPQDCQNSGAREEFDKLIGYDIFKYGNSDKIPILKIVSS